MPDACFKTGDTSAELLARYENGDQRAADAIFDRYATRLIRLARSRLALKLAGRVDAEDIVMSAYRSFFAGARHGRFAVERGGDLWRLLVEVTLHKLYRQVARHQADRRSVEREELTGGDGEVDRRSLSREPSPDEAAMAAETLEAVLAELPARGRRALELRLAGHELREIAKQSGCNERTVRRWLDVARRVITSRAGDIFAPVSHRRGAPRRQPRVLAQQPLPALHFDNPLAYSDFVLNEQIGASATGKVYRATRKHDGQEVVIKFLRKRLMRERRAIEQFLREARIQLRHSGIVVVEGIGRTPCNGLFLVMELVRGANLHDIALRGPIKPLQAAAWVADAARALHFAHERGVVHCDLKPGNLLLDELGTIRVTDFGLAIQPDIETDQRLLAGTPAFMAPEQVDDCWGPISPRTDVYGLGAVLYFLLCGQPPYSGDGIADVLSKIVSGQPFRLPGGVGISYPLESILTRALAKASRDRFQTAADMAAALTENRLG